MTDSTDSTVPDSLDRRQFVGTLGVLGAAALAGCPNDDDEPANPPGESGPETALPPDEEPSGPVVSDGENGTSNGNESADGNESSDGTDGEEGTATVAVDEDSEDEDNESDGEGE